MGAQAGRATTYNPDSTAAEAPRPRASCRAPPEAKVTPATFPPTSEALAVAVVAPLEVPALAAGHGRSRLWVLVVVLRAWVRRRELQQRYQPGQHGWRRPEVLLGLQLRLGLCRHRVLSLRISNAR